jgi:hypothetical protein
VKHEVDWLFVLCGLALTEGVAMTGKRHPEDCSPAFRRIRSELQEKNSLF